MKKLPPETKESPKSALWRGGPAGSRDLAALGLAARLPVRNLTLRGVLLALEHRVHRPVAPLLRRPLEQRVVRHDLVAEVLVEPDPLDDRIRRDERQREDRAHD